MYEIGLYATEAITLIFVGIASFLLGSAVERKLGRRSETVIVWRDSDGNPFRRLRIRGEFERAPWTAELPEDFYTSLSDWDRERRIEAAKDMAIEKGGA